MRLARLVTALSVVVLPSLSYGQTFTWNVNGNGVWNNNGSWLPNTGFPNSTTHEALFGNIASGSLVTLTAPVTVNRLTLDGITGTTQYTIGLSSATAITLGGAGALVQSNANVTSTGE